MPSGQTVFKSSQGLGSGETNESRLKQPGADSVSGVVTRSTTSYNINLRWLDETNTVVETEAVASAVAGGTQTTFDVPARGPYVEIQVEDDGAGSGSFDLVGHLR
jgi:hypothetical protein